MAATVKGPLDWGASRDAEGYRVFTLKLLIESEYSDGPYTIMNASGLPTIGSSWSYGGDSDPWSFCLPEATFRYDGQKKGGEKFRYWNAEMTFTNKPQRRCQDTSIDNPLEEPPKISGSFSRYQKPTQKDKNGKLILSSSHEIITGLEKEANRPQVVVEFNDASLGLGTFAQMVNGVNDAVLWGVIAGGVMLTDVAWSRQLFGTCNFYFTKRFTFDIKFDGWKESDIADRGFKHYLVDVYGGEKANPENYFVIKDANDDKSPSPTMLKEGEINPDPVNDPQFLPPVEFYSEYNFLTLGIPSSLE